MESVDTRHALLVQAKRSQCGAKTRSGNPCKGAPMANGRCRMHGGNARRGIASGTYKHGKYSRYLPGGIQQAYEQSRTDPDLLNLTEEIALLYSRMHELLAGLQPENPHNLQVAKDWRHFRPAQERRDSAGMLRAAERIDTIVEGAAGNDAVWEQVTRLLAQIAALAEQEQKRRVAMSGLMRTDRVQAFARDLLLIVREETDPATWQRVQTRVSELLGAPPYSTVVEGE